MAVFKCGHCGVKGHFTPFGNGVVSRNPDSYQFEHCEQALSCDSCERLTIAMSEDLGFADHVTGGSTAWNLFWNNSDVDEHFPKWVEGQKFDDVPAHIGDAASEAHRTFSIDAIRSSVLMARSVIEATCKDHGITSGSLATKINAMFKATHITEYTKNVADTIRTFGNDMAHGDFIVDLDSEDAREVLAFMDEFLQQVYQMKARLGRLEDAAKARKAASKESQ